jgi:hypothetical protein
MPGTAAAQRNNYDVKTMNFDLWCQEQAHLPIERCDKRTPEDEKNFSAYRAKVEAYEIPYLQQKENAARLDNNLLHNDPQDNPISRDQAQSRQDNKEPPRQPPP